MANPELVALMAKGTRSGEAGKFVSNVSLDVDHIPERKDRVRENVIFLDDSVIPNAPYFTVAWFYKDTGPMQKPHTHDHDEHIGFVGSDPEHPQELNATFRILLDGEWFETDKSCVVFLKAGTEHCPYELKDVKKPVFHWSAVDGQYE